MAELCSNSATAIFPTHDCFPYARIARTRGDRPKAKSETEGAAKVPRYIISKELFSSAPFRCLASRQGNLRTQNLKPESKNQTEARSPAQPQLHSNFKTACRNAENTTSKEINGRSVNNPPATAKKSNAKGKKNSVNTRLAHSQQSHYQRSTGAL